MNLPKHHVCIASEPTHDTRREVTRLIEERLVPMLRQQGIEVVNYSDHPQKPQPLCDRVYALENNVLQTVGLCIAILDSSSHALAVDLCMMKNEGIPLLGFFWGSSTEQSKMADAFSPINLDVHPYTSAEDILSVVLKVLETTPRHSNLFRDTRERLDRQRANGELEKITSHEVRM